MRRARSRRRHVRELAAEGRHDRPDVDAVGRPEQLLVVLGQPDAGRVGRRLGQEREDPAAVVVDQDDRRGQVVEARRDQRVEVVQERQVADDQRDRTDLRRGRAEGRRDDAVDAVGAPVRQRPDRAGAARQPVVHVADRHAVAGPQERAVGQESAEHARTAGPRTPRRAPRRRRATPRAHGRRPGPRRTRHAPRRRSRLARRAAPRRGHRAVAVASAWTNVVGMIAGSLQPRSPSTTICAGIALSSSVSIGFEVVVAPKRMTRSGRWASRHGPGRTRWSAWASTNERSCGPQRTPDSGSATIGNPVAAARRARAAGSSGSSVRAGDDEPALRRRRGEPARSRIALADPAPGRPATTVGERADVPRHRLGRRAARAPRSG